MAYAAAAPSSKRLKRSFSAISQPSQAMDVDVAQNRAIAGLKRKVKSLSAGVEKRNAFTTIANTGVGTGGLLTSLDVVAQGDASTSRDGLTITPLFVEWNVLFESEIADAYNIMGMMIVQAKGGAALTSADFGGVGIPPSEAQLQRYTVLYNRTFLLENGQLGDPVSGYASYTKYSKYQGKVKVPRKIAYPDAGSASNTNSLHVWFISDSAAVNHPDVELLQARLAYHD